MFKGDFLNNKATRYRDKFQNYCSQFFVLNSYLSIRLCLPAEALCKSTNALKFKFIYIEREQSRFWVIGGRLNFFKIHPSRISICTSFSRGAQWITQLRFLLSDYVPALRPPGNGSTKIITPVYATTPTRKYRRQAREREREWERNCNTRSRRDRSKKHFYFPVM